MSYRLGKLLDGAPLTRAAVVGALGDTRELLQRCRAPQSAGLPEEDRRHHKMWLALVAQDYVQAAQARANGGRVCTRGGCAQGVISATGNGSSTGIWAPGGREPPRVVSSGGGCAPQGGFSSTGRGSASSSSSASSAETETVSLSLGQSAVAACRKRHPHASASRVANGIFNGAAYLHVAPTPPVECQLRYMDT